MELFLFAYCMLLVSLVCGMACLWERSRARKREKEQRQAELLIEAVRKMPRYSLTLRAHRSEAARVEVGELAPRV